jgi:hypothetical protein
VEVVEERGEEFPRPGQPGVEVPLEFLHRSVALLHRELAEYFVDIVSLHWRTLRDANWSVPAQQE